MMCVGYASLLIAAFTLSHPALGFNPVVETSSGTVMGRRVQHRDKEVDVFYGIPYAKPPLGDYRFREPFPVEPWSGTYNATFKRPSCVQIKPKEDNSSYSPLLKMANMQPVSEDCLTLNVWRPASCGGGDCRDLPVFVYIFGGGFAVGDASIFIYDGVHFVASTEVIYVTMNYRVSIFGFLDAGNKEIPGNMGLLDQVMALRWVKNNIRHFGGDPDMVTLGGQSAGAISVGYHAISPMSKGLFRRIIMESGSPLSTVGLHHASGPGQMIAVANVAGCYDLSRPAEQQIDEMIRCLRKKDAEELLRAAQEGLGMKLYLYFPRIHSQFMPLDPSDPDTYSVNAKEVFFGLTKNEGLLFAYVIHKKFQSQTDFIQSNFPTVMRTVLRSFFQHMPARAAHDIAVDYMDGKDELSEDELKAIASAVFGDIIFTCPIQLFAEVLIKKKVPLYHYAFMHKPTASFLGNFSDEVTHAEELPFTRGVIDAQRQEYQKITAGVSDPVIRDFVTTPEEVQFSEELIRTWAAFIKTGKPKIPKSDMEWPKYTKENKAYVILKPNDYSVAYGPRSKKCHLWEPYLVKRQQSPTTPAPKHKPTPKRIPEKRPGKPLRPLDNFVESSASTGPLSSATALASMLFAIALNRS